MSRDAELVAQTLATLNAAKGFADESRAVRDSIAELGGSKSKGMIFTYLQQLMDKNEEFLAFRSVTPDPFEQLRLWAATLPDGSTTGKVALMSAEFANTVLDLGSSALTESTCSSSD